MSKWMRFPIFFTVILLIVACQNINIANGKCETPTFSPPAGTYTSIQSVAIASATQGASIFYTTDGSAPKTTSTRYSAPISVDRSMTVQAIATKTDMDDSDVSSAVYAVNLPSTAKAITSFSFTSPAVTGVINETNHTISVTVPYLTPVTALVANFSTTGSAVTVNGVAQFSGATPNSFVTPVTYRVTAADSSTQDYVVTVTVALNSSKAITSFAIKTPSASGFIDEGNHTIAVEVPYGTSLNLLIANFATSGSAVTVNGVVQTSGTTSNNFSAPVTYRVTAADSTTQDYIVTVTVASSSAKALTAFSFASPAATGVITEASHTVAVSVPYGTNVTALVATFDTTGASVMVGATTQVSGTTPNNFTSPVTYRVTAGDTSYQDYTVTVTVALNPAKDITAFSFSSPAATGSIVGTAISVSVPPFTDVRALVANFTTTGASVKIGATVQTSGATINDFTGALVYRVTAADSTTKDYTVTVTKAAITWTNYTNTQGLPSHWVYDVFVSGTNIYLATAAGISVSADAGSTWTTKNAMAVDDIRCIHVSGTTIYAGTYNGGLITAIPDYSSWTAYKVTPDGLADD
ncbi:MAG: chitobiase/beta-hexosaminidase C-terminal domain-containing protein, partial [Treponemataceae bacterium]